MMAQGKIYIFVEGNDDERFFKRIIEPRIPQRVIYIKYAQLKKKIVINYLRTIQNSDDDYIFAADLDDLPNPSAKIKWVRHKFENYHDKKEITIPKKNIAIVIIEVESWYIAGMSDSFALMNNLDAIIRSEWVTKEVFNNIFHGKFRSRIDFMQELMKHFAFNSALEKNKSFKYFNDTFLKN